VARCATRAAELGRAVDVPGVGPTVPLPRSAPAPRQAEPGNHSSALPLRDPADHSPVKERR
jgi:hypothetical protein